MTTSGNDISVTSEQYIARLVYTPPEVFNPDLLQPRKRRVLIITSYCGDDNPECTEDRPCNDCLRMCNVAVVVVGQDAIIGSFE